MKERNTITKLFKADDPEQLIVFRAASMEDQIRFYFNDTQYIAAIEDERGCEIKLGDDEKQNITQGMDSSIKFGTKESIKELMMSLFICMEFILLIIIGISCLNEDPISIIAMLFVLHYGVFIFRTVNVVILEYVVSSFSIKSKHSAEHMMVNFLKINKRLPQSIDEVKKCSRFHSHCGSRELITDIAEDFVRSMYAIMSTLCISAITLYFFDDPLLNEAVIVITYLLFEFKVFPKIAEHGMLDFIIRPIKKVLTNIAQLGNTTSKVKDEDIILAYSAAKPWLKVVYPQFYNENEDVFWGKYYES